MSTDGGRGGLAKGVVFDAILLAYLLVLATVAAYGPSPEQMLMLGRNSFVGLILLAASATAALALRRAGVATVGSVVFEKGAAPKSGELRPWYRSFWAWQLLLVLGATFYVGARETEMSLYELTDEAGFRGATNLFRGIFSPNFAILPKAVLAIIETVYIAFMATLIAVPVAFVLSFTAAKNIMSRHPATFAFYVALRTALNVSRSVEPLIWAIIFSVWVGIGPFAGMLALMIHSIASLAKQYSEIVECVEDGPIEGIQSTGASFIQTIWFAIVPQIVLPYISFTIYRWDINVRMATVIGMVGGGGIGTILYQYQGQAMWPEVGCLVVVIAAVVWLMDTASAYIREAIK
ncbi:MAG: phosphonate ABC transporter, permease protein PhnE [Candidatus Schekmanbacteria bacterium]|nr:phosphonate ABC transporter, permease protein PhnE [Candidatus Schekmanbacteria bacterium]